MDIGDARDVCVEEGVPFDAVEPVEALRQKLRAHFCGGGEPAPEPAAEPEEQAAAAAAKSAGIVAGSLALDPASSSVLASAEELSAGSLVMALVSEFSSTGGAASLSSLRGILLVDDD